MPTGQYARPRNVLTYCESLNTLYESPMTFASLHGILCEHLLDTLRVYPPPPILCSHSVQKTFLINNDFFIKWRSESKCWKSKTQSHFASARIRPARILYDSQIVRRMRKNVFSIGCACHASTIKNWLGTKQE